MKNLYLFFWRRKIAIEQQVVKIKENSRRTLWDKVNYIVLDGKNISSEEMINACCHCSHDARFETSSCERCCNFESGKSGCRKL